MEADHSIEINMNRFYRQITPNLKDSKSVKLKVKLKSKPQDEKEGNNINISFIPPVKLTNEEYRGLVEEEKKHTKLSNKNVKIVANKPDKIEAFVKAHNLYLPIKGKCKDFQF